MTLGPVMLDVAGYELDEEDRRRLCHPQTGGVILFSRNYRDPQQLAQLCQQIHELREPRLIVSVDHEGGRVQRFREGFQAIPAMGSLGELYDSDAAQALQLAEVFAWMMSAELLHYGIDLSFAPVLDIGDPVSSVIGDRAFHRDPQAIAHLANAWVRGMRKAGMEAVGKHFPGHGSVEGDSHHVMPFDRRPFDAIEALDLAISLAGPKTRVIPGHGVAVVGRKELVQFRDMVVDTSRRVRTLITEGKTLDEVMMARPTAAYDAQWGTVASWSDNDFIPIVYHQLGGGSLYER